MIPLMFKDSYKTVLVTPETLISVLNRQKSQKRITNSVIPSKFYSLENFFNKNSDTNIQLGNDETFISLFTSITLSTLIVGLTLCFSLRIFDHQFVPAFFTTTLSLACGGSGFLTFISQHKFDVNQIFFYDYIESFSSDLSNRAYWKSILSQLLFEDKNCLYGFPLVLCIIILFYISLYSAIIETKFIVRLMFFAGILTSILPLLHRESFFGVLVISACCLLSNPLELYKINIFAGWFVFLLPVLLFGFPFELHYIIRAVLAPPIERGPKSSFVPPYLKLQPIWYFDKTFKKTLKSKALIPKLIIPFLFWIKNLWLFVPLYFMGIYQVFRRIPIGDSLKNFCYAGTLMFFVLNYFLFFDSKISNVQLFQIWVFVSSFVVVVLFRFFSRKKWGKVLCFFLFLSLISSAGLSILHRSVSSQSIQIAFNQEDIEFAAWIDENTPRDCNLLSISNNKNAGIVLAGRSMKIGYKPWLYELGHYNTTAATLLSSLHVFSKGTEAQKVFLREIDYILIDSYTTNNSQFNSTVWENPKGISLLHDTENYKLYKVTGRPKYSKKLS